MGFVGLSAAGVLFMASFGAGTNCTNVHDCNESMCSPCAVASVVPLGGFAVLGLLAVVALLAKRPSPTIRRNVFVLAALTVTVVGFKLTMSWS